jgi:hypothetical protein
MHAQMEEGRRLFSQGLYARASAGLSELKRTMQGIMDGDREEVMALDEEDPQEENEQTQGYDFWCTSQGMHVYCTPAFLVDLQDVVGDHGGFPLNATQVKYVLSMMMIAVNFNLALAQHLMAIELVDQGESASAKTCMAHAMVCYATALPLDKASDKFTQVSRNGRVFAAIYNNMMHLCLLQEKQSLAVPYGKDLFKFLAAMVVTGRITTDEDMYHRFQENLEHIDIGAVQTPE